MTTDRITVMTSVASAAITAFRKREGITRAEFAEAAWEHGAPATFTATVVGALETGRRSAGGRRREITLDELVFLAATIGVPPVALLGEQAVVFTGDTPAQCPRCTARTGTLQRRVREDIDALGDLAGVDPSLAETAYVLAEAIDSGGGEGGRMLPRLTRELRATLEQILASAPAGDLPDDDEDDDLAEPE
ncbi:hypothetical protein [Actinocrispum wychmicini]|uniref:HTH cro/C1-type domain-containing protein n=1 Tax=Actinocrispum wychmicini TaxID=1213861 RepID=A0A4R2K039_9PSEU|nr:hypothetical protein [Actinocrispum wychmicini]TCO64942.1 hypothetical protein EV192_101726 [Actinocrispum wychmicini]